MVVAAEEGLHAVSVVVMGMGQHRRIHGGPRTDAGQPPTVHSRARHCRNARSDVGTDACADARSHRGSDACSDSGAHSGPDC